MRYLRTLLRCMLGGAVLAVAVPARTAHAVDIAASRQVLLVLATMPGVDAPRENQAAARVAAVYRDQVGLILSIETRTVLLPAQQCETFGDTRSAAMAAIDGWAAYDHVVVALRMHCADVGGLGELPGMWSVVYGDAVNDYVVVHELAHNLGLGHSMYSSCVSTGDVRFGPEWRTQCAATEYVDGYTPTATRLVQFSAPELVRLGAAIDVVDVATDGYVELAPLSGSGGVRAIRIPGNGDIDTWWLEYRVRRNSDRLLPTDQRVILRGEESTSLHPIVFDVAGTGSGEDIGLQQTGASFTTPDGSVTIVVERLDDVAGVRIVRRGVDDTALHVADVDVTPNTAGVTFTFTSNPAAVRGYVATVRTPRGERSTWIPAGVVSGAVPYELAGAAIFELTALGAGSTHGVVQQPITDGRRPGSVRRFTARARAGSITLSWTNPCACTSIEYHIEARAAGHGGRRSTVRGSGATLTGIPRGVWTVTVTPSLRGVRGAPIHRRITVAAGSVGIDVARRGRTQAIEIRFRRAPNGPVQLWWQNRTGTDRRLIAHEEAGWSGVAVYETSLPRNGVFEVVTQQRRYTAVGG